MTTIYLFDPRSNVQEETTVEAVVGFSGLTRKTVLYVSRQRRRITPTGCYLSRDPFTREERRQLHLLEPFPTEVWREVGGYNGKYQVSDHGRVRSRRNSGPSREILMPYRRKGSLHVKLCQHGDERHVPVARLVAEAFIGRRRPDQVVIHKNRIWYDNHINNLGYIDRRMFAKRVAKLSSARPVLKIDPVTAEIVDEYVSVEEAARENFMGTRAIRKTCQGERPDAFGIRFCFEIDYGKPVYRLDPFTLEVTGEYRSVTDAAHFNGLAADVVRGACRDNAVLDGWLYCHKAARHNVRRTLV